MMLSGRHNQNSPISLILSKVEVMRNIRLDQLLKNNIKFIWKETVRKLVWVNFKRKITETMKDAWD